MYIYIQYYEGRAGKFSLLLMESLGVDSQHKQPPGENPVYRLNTGKVGGLEIPPNPSNISSLFVCLFVFSQTQAVSIAL